MLFWFTVAGACVEGKRERGQGLPARLLFVAEIP